MRIGIGSVLSFSAIFGACLYVATAHADKTTNNMPPPKEAIQACTSKSENDACNFLGKQKENMTGTCRKNTEANTLACVPTSGNAQPQQGGQTY